MIKIQTVSKYIALSEEGLVSKLECPMDQGLLFPNLDRDDSIFLYCLSCGYRSTIGSAKYEQLAEAVKDVLR